MDHDAPEAREATSPATSRTSRRALLGLGIGGAAASLLPLLTGRASASASTDAATTTAPPKRPTADDTALLGAAQQVELAAVALYEGAISGVSGWTEAQAAVMTTFRDAHLAYANSLSALLGKAAPGTAAESVLTKFQRTFVGDPAGVCAAAWSLESAAVATHGEVLGSLQGIDGAALVASIQIAEARHCTVLADLAGITDPALLLVDDEEAPLSVNG